MSITIGYDGKFLESITNLRGVLKKSIGRQPSVKIAKGATVCLQHGRLYFDAAKKAPMEIKPLLIFYGMANYAKSLVVARNFKTLESLQQKHGVKDKSKANARLEELAVEILEQGTFQEFNDTVCMLDCIFFTKEHMTECVSLPTSNSEILQHKILTLRDILARISGLKSLYSATFGEEAKTVSVSLGFMEERNGYVELRIDDKEIFTNVETRKSITEKWRTKYSFLKNWYLIAAERAWDHSILVFANVDKESIDKLSDKIAEEENGNYHVARGTLRNVDCNCVNFWEILDPAARGLMGTERLIEPFDNTHISEPSLYYLGMFLLSSLVRYRPQIWGHSISRLVTSDSPSDDKALSLIESFMEQALSTFSNAIVKAMSIQIKVNPSGNVPLSPQTS